MWTYVGIAVAVVLVIAVFQRKTLQRVWDSLMAQVGKLGRWIWKADPVALYQAEVDRSADEIREGTSGLEQYRGLVTRVQRQVENNKKEKARLEARIKTHLVAGNEDKAATYAVELKKVEADLKENETQLASYETSYKNNLKKIQYARQRIEAAKEKAHKLDADLKLSQAEAETAKLAEKFNVRTNTLEGLGEIEEEIQRQIDTNRGKAQVIADLSADGLAEIEEEEAIQKAEAKATLEEMKASLGLNKKE